MKKALIVSDVHQDFNSLDAAVEAAMREGVDTGFFLGDALLNKSNHHTNFNSQMAQQVRSQLMVDSSLRQNSLEGVYSDKQLKNIADKLEFAKKSTIKVAAADYKDLKTTMSKLKEFIALGGNHDTKHIAEALGDNYVNGDFRNVGGIDVAAFSGGGSAFPQGIMYDTLADNPQEKDYQYAEWQNAFSQENMQKAVTTSVFLSHLEPTDGECVEKQNAVEHYKDMLRKLNQIKRTISDEEKEAIGVVETPVFIHGHQHGSGLVEYNEEMEGFRVNPGPCSKNHNDNSIAPTFMIGDFDDDEKLVKVNQYQVRSSLKEVENIVLAEEHTLDYENKKVDTKEINKSVFSRANKKVFKSNLKLDGNYNLVKKGLNTSYEGKSIAQKDGQLRLNIGVIFDDIDEKGKTIKEVLRGAIADSANNGHIDKEAAKLAIKKVRDELSDIVMRKFNTNLDHIAEDKRDYFKELLIEIEFGIPTETMEKVLLEHTPDTVKDAGSWGNELVQMSSKSIQGLAIEYLLSPFEAKDLQSMAEIYLPQNYKRRGELLDQEAKNLWIKTFQQGLLTQADMEEVPFAYEINDNFKGDKKTKKELADMFDFEYKSDEQVKQEEEQAIKAQQEKQMEATRNYIKEQGAIRREDGKEYVIDQQGQPALLDRDKYGLKEGDYRVVDEKDLLDQRISQGEQQVNALKSHRDGNLEENLDDLTADNVMNIPEDIQEESRYTSPSIDLPHASNPREIIDPVNAYRDVA